MSCGGGFCDRAAALTTAVLFSGVLILGFFWICNYFMDGGMVREFKLDSKRGALVLKTNMTPEEIRPIVQQDIHLSSTMLKDLKMSFVILDDSMYMLEFKKNKLVNAKFFSKKE